VAGFFASVTDAGIEPALELLNTARPGSAFQRHPVARQLGKVTCQAPNIDQACAI